MMHEIEDAIGYMIMSFVIGGIVAAVLVGALIVGLVYWLV